MGDAGRLVSRTPAKLNCLCALRQLRLKAHMDLNNGWHVKTYKIQFHKRPSSKAICCLHFFFLVPVITMLVCNDIAGQNHIAGLKAQPSGIILSL